jgi:ribosome-associated translation inhibitor RaiA
MASISREESPPPRADSTTPSISAKRKRDDSLDIHSHANGVQELKSEEAAQDPQSLIQDLFDVLKM